MIKYSCGAWKQTLIEVKKRRAKNWQNRIRIVAAGIERAANETLKGAIFGAILGGVVSGTQYLAAIGSKTKEVGTYILRNAEGKVKYVGKGSYERMLVSLNKKGLATGQFIKASDETMAFIREALFIDQFGGAQSMGGILKNLINSPGLKFLFWWL